MHDSEGLPAEDPLVPGYLPEAKPEEGRLSPQRRDGSEFYEAFVPSEVLDGLVQTPSDTLSSRVGVDVELIDLVAVEVGPPDYRSVNNRDEAVGVVDHPTEGLHGPAVGPRFHCVGGVDARSRDPDGALDHATGSRSVGGHRATNCRKGHRPHRCPTVASLGHQHAGRAP